MNSNRYLFASADVGRAGLGNMLFPWARAEVFAKDNGCRMLAPRWTQPKIGPLLRREKDLRYYTGLFSSRGYVRGLARLLLQLRGRRIEENAAIGQANLEEVTEPTIVTFKGMSGDYETLYEHRDFVQQRLLEILSPRVRSLVENAPHRDYIGMHVRFGDKIPLEFGRPFPVPDWSSRLPLEWFIHCIKNIRGIMGSPLAIRVFSDAREGELAELLSLGDVSLAPKNPSIVDILLLARSRLLITTGSSSFSSWAAFLGGMPAVWYPQSSLWAPTLRQRLDERGAPQPETSVTGDIPDDFVSMLRSIAKSTSAARQA